MDKLKLEYNWTIYLYTIIGVITIGCELFLPLKFKEEETALAFWGINNWIAIILIGNYYFKIIGYNSFREGLPLLMFMINRVVYVFLNIFIFDSYSINWKMFTILCFLELLLAVIYVFDEWFYDYIYIKEVDKN